MKSRAKLVRAPALRRARRARSSRATDAAEGSALDAVSAETSSRVIARVLAEPAKRTAKSLDAVARELAKPARKRRTASLAEVARQIAAPAKKRRRAPRLAVEGVEPDDARGEAMDRRGGARAVMVELIAGRGHYERVIAAVAGAHTSLWIATANVKELLVEDSRGRYVSILDVLDELAERGVELRLLHAELPSRPFREELRRHPRLEGGLLALRRCPRVHMKLVVVDGALAYVGSANWTGAGLGAKGSGRRNFEVGVVSDDAPLLDEVQGMFEHVWSGAACARCRLREQCPGPLDEL